MTAAELVKAFKRQKSSSTALAGVVYRLVLEAKNIAKERGATSNEELIVIFKEQDEVWREFVKLSKERLRLDGFRRYIHYKMPTVSKLLTDGGWPVDSSGIDNERKK